MTTIAWKGGILAVDNQVTVGDNQKAKASIKTVEDKNNSRVFAITGSLTRGLRFIEDLKSNTAPGDRTKLKGTIVLEFDLKTGRLLSWESRHLPLPIESRYWADGSGCQFAMGAMDAGASAEEAIKIASRHDCYTGFGITVWRSERARSK